MSDFPIAPEELRRLARLVEQHDLAELRYEEGSLRVTLRTTVPTLAVPVAGATVAAPLPLTAAPVAAGATATAAAPTGTPIEAPIMGVFYRSPAPGAPSFVEVGDTVEKDQPIGMIEAMKVFSEVLADHAGRVVAIPAENGKLVQPGDPLVLLES
ncbi:biotin/lipoyl-containing protein [Armatimonas rosea]|uniref:Biotin carboxyl carrier protein of acetyl-CoA carboxylase n=1 Tax=Armatimonas rosea TaxID=685828 RepID=A0A7W9STD2_ARMRO|nr:acetyl-CoA carboxylase biotin carboxyl carrier protein [Armatimonas rosea]